MSLRVYIPLLLLLSACGGPDCGLPEIALALAGSGATDCGTVSVDADRSTTDACAVAAFTAGTAFFAVYELQGIDSAVSSATVSDGATALFLTYDSDPSGGSNVGARVSETVCADPAVTAGEAGHDVVSCEAAACSCDEESCGADGACCVG